MTDEWKPIDGETPIDPSHLKDRSIRTRPQLNAAEAQNMRKAHVKYLAARPSRRAAPFDYSWFCRVHQEMFGEVWHWAGQLRTGDLNIGVPWHQVSAQLMDLANDLSLWAKTADMTLVEQAARLHHRAVAIHPFYNGNGRWARLLANVWLYTHKGPITYWPEETISAGSPIRRRYLAAIRAADDGNYALLIELHEEFSSPSL